MSYIALWSGGKDSCLACWEAIRQGLPVSHLVNFISGDTNRVRFHGTEAALVRLQAEAAGIALAQSPTSDDDYEPAFKRAVKKLIPTGVEGMIFGDLYIDQHREWVERVSAELGIKAVVPLWGREPASVLCDFIDAGFESVVVSANAEKLDSEWIGRKVGREFIAYANERGFDPCGENGEYHTVVVNGPLFHRRIEITRSRTVRRGGYWFLDTQEYGLIAKEVAAEA